MTRDLTELDESGVAPIEPPVGTRIRYRLGGSVSADYRPWVERDVASTSFLWWQLLPIGLGLLTALATMTILFPDQDPRPSLLGLAIGALSALVTFKGSTRRLFLERHEKRWAKAQRPDVPPDSRRFP